jgi:hypothetical protein
MSRGGTNLGQLSSFPDFSRVLANHGTMACKIHCRIFPFNLEVSL